ncbi:putative spermidine/putrescine transport system permease protein [Halobacillus dabanensis]|uniref:Putative spermidine/putrescine transport system permease protein n=1 Tax=Halobacillus dabanensis TaxID=240302 RepID=A0A1I3YYE4_HALDA|nr:ABC transporter permease subunit [Halobacillus dabanensis]SFK36858.1 putative spermidine/putrescine transport system permease protein [Halobacillus dabanensis]
MRSRKISFSIIACVFFVFPMILLLLQSVSSPWRFQSEDGFTWQWTSYQKLLQDPMLWEATLTSIVIGYAVLVINFIIGLFTGKALVSSPYKGKAWVEAILLSPILLPVLAIAMGLHLLMIRIGLADTLIGVILLHLVPTVPYSIKIFYNGYNQTGPAMMEQSNILGAGFWTQIFTVELPLLRPAIRSLTFLTIVISLSQYAITAIIGGGRILTLPLVFFPYMENANTSLMAAFSIWFAVIPVTMYIVIELLILLLPYSRLPWRNHR